MCAERNNISTDKTGKKRKRNKKIRKQFTKFKMIYSNINHCLSKIESLKRIIEEEKPAVVAVVETKLAEGADIKIDGYESWPMNRDENGGGIMVWVKKELENIVVAVEKQREVGETMWMTITNGRTKIFF